MPNVSEKLQSASIAKLDLDIVIRVRAQGNAVLREDLYFGVE